MFIIDLPPCPIEAAGPCSLQPKVRRSRCRPLSRTAQRTPSPTLVYWLSFNAGRHRYGDPGMLMTRHVSRGRGYGWSNLLIRLTQSVFSSLRRPGDTAAACALCSEPLTSPPLHAERAEVDGLNCRLTPKLSGARPRCPNRSSFIETHRLPPTLNEATPRVRSNAS
jgi:hypothetical protein